MMALIITIPLSILFAVVFIGLFIWSVKSGQLDQIESQKNMIFNRKINRKKGTNHVKNNK
ncbi:cbb3-type cytochrome oxidase assembly protein CcoS [Bacteriovoracaceae bacterium]|nr:cbb3-type cytochrome oxidase assembly protein CcoS [Bacteriovoracaceae bacterium]